MRRLEWSVDPFQVEGSAEEANVAGLRLTTRAIERPGAAARTEAAEGGRARQPAGARRRRPHRRRACPLRRGTHLRPRGEGRLRPGRGRGDRTRQPGRRSRLAPGARGRHGRRAGPRRHLRHRGRPRAGRGHPRQRGAGHGALPGPRGARRPDERARPRRPGERERERPPGAARRGALGAPALRGDGPGPVALRGARVAAHGRFAVVPRVGVGRPRGDGAEPRGPARRGAVHAGRVEDAGGHVRPRRPRHVAPRRRAARAGDPPPRRSAGDARGERRHHARPGPPGARPPSPAPSTCVS